MPKMNILGVYLDCLSYAEMYPLFDQWLADKSTRSHTILLVNAYNAVSAFFDKPLARIYNSADIVGIDSMPFLFWARAFYKKNIDRFYAPDLMEEISRNAKRKGYTYFIYGGYPGAPDAIEKYLTDRFEGIRVVGKYSPPFRALTDEESKNLYEMINQAQPDFFWVGLGSPKQDKWIFENREKIRGAIMIASGATFDFFSGRIKQAPLWVRKTGFEWLYRLFHDFRRLWVRYTVYNLIFVGVFLLQLLHIIKFEVPPAKPD